MGKPIWNIFKGMAKGTKWGENVENPEVENFVTQSTQSLSTLCAYLFGHNLINRTMTIINQLVRYYPHQRFSNINIVFLPDDNIQC